MGVKWITPFKKQCIVVVGASANMAQLGMVMGYAAVLLPQLRDASSTIPIDDSSGSWIAALPGFALLVGNLMVPSLMAKLGRRWANIISIVIVIAGWLCIFAAEDITMILLARLLQGLSVGMSSCLTPILIGEYTSPKNRGAFMIMMSLIMAAATLVVHALGSYCSWKLTALIIATIATVDLVIVALCPETPSWLADQGKYEKSEKVFRWLRGDEELDELHKMIQASINAKQTKHVDSPSNKIVESITTLKKKEFYKPIIIMIHLYTMSQWGGINILAPYAADLVVLTCGPDFNVPLTIVSVDVLRVISSVSAAFIIRKIKRRTMLFAACGINALVFLISAVYIYAKSTNPLVYDHPILGAILIHALMVTVAIGSLPLPLAIAGEIFALKYKSLSSGFSCLFSSTNIFLSTKTFPYLLRTIGLHGAYCLYAFIMIYCLSVVWFMLPETKDRTLQEIEEEFKGRKDDDLKAAVPLTEVYKG